MHQLNLMQVDDSEIEVQLLSVEFGLDNEILRDNCAVETQTLCICVRHSWRDNAVASDISLMTDTELCADVKE